MSKLMMSWNDRLALIDHYKPSDEQACGAFGLSQDELDTARQLRQAGTFGSTRGFDVSKYKHVFSASSAQATPPKPPSTPVTTITSDKRPTPPTMNKTGGATVHSKPETASRKAKVPQKRGRKGDKIIKAFESVPITPVPVTNFIQQYGISLAVLRQSKRFIENLDTATQQTIGKINVRQDKATKQLMVWKESN